MTLSLTPNTLSGKLSPLSMSSMLSNGRGVRCMASVHRQSMWTVIFVLVPLMRPLIFITLKCRARESSEAHWLTDSQITRYMTQRVFVSVAAWSLLCVRIPELCNGHLSSSRRELGSSVK